MPSLQRFTTPEDVSRAAAAEFVRSAGEAIAARGRFTVALAGGSTPRRMYQLLSEPPLRERVDWPRVEFFWGDDRCVPPEHADSNYRMANESLLSKLPLRPSQVHRMPAERADRDRAAGEYQEEIAQVFGVTPTGTPPAFDLILLGMGSDGHTLSLFPHTTALAEPSRWVVSNWIDKLQTHRLTFTAPLACRAVQRLFCVTGADKAGPLAEVLQGPRDPQRLPSQLLVDAEGQTIWLVDHAAAAQLP